MQDDIWNARRKKLENEVRDAAEKLLAHTRASSFKLVLPDGRAILCGIAMKTVKKETPQ